MEDLCFTRSPQAVFAAGSRYNMSVLVSTVLSSPDQSSRLHPGESATECE